MWDDRGGCPGHEWGDEIEGKSQSGALNGSTLDGAPPGKERRPEWSSQFCIHCHAWLGSLGLEPTPELYLKHLVDIFREIKRVLRKDGTLWLNLGDSYNGSGPSGGMGKQYTNKGSQNTTPKNVVGLKPKDLIGIPWRAALALQADGWWLRSDIIWHKPNPMPESVTDRPTRSHEYVFLLSRSAKYYYDADAVREPGVTREVSIEEYKKMLRETGEAWYPRVSRNTDNSGGKHGKKFHAITPPGGRNLRSVWTIPTSPTPEAHFATFSPKLVEPCIKAGCPPGGVVLDPFLGAGTTAVVAHRLGRKCIGIELSRKYLNNIAILKIERATAQRVLGFQGDRNEHKPNDSE